VIADIRLGLRLARGGGAGGRVRGAANVVAQLIGSWVVLTMLAIIRAELERLSYRDADSERLILAIVATVGVPVVVLVATTGRLSAVLRDRRLAGLRTLGLSRSRTRLVAAVEAGAGGFVGCLLGLVAFWITRPVIHGLRVGGRDWSSLAFAPWPLAAALVMIGLPLVAVVVALVPGAHVMATPGSRANATSTQKRPSPWRARRVIRAAQWWEAALPLVVGVVLAIGAGTAVGAAYLVLAESYDASPWGSVLTLGAVSLVAAIGIAGVTVVACAPRIRAELIRRA
jgi:putative ABC transport system permease protein